MTEQVDPGALTAVLDERWAELLEQLRELVATGHPRLGFDREHGGEGDVGGSVVSFQLLGYGDLSLMVKAGVQWGLFGGAVQMLGTRRHHERYLRDIMSLDPPGCFAMTESTTSATPPATGGWPSCSPSSSSATGPTACTRSWCRSGTRRGNRRRVCGSRTAARRPD